MAWYKSKKGWAAVVAAILTWLDRYEHFISARDVYLLVRKYWDYIAPLLPFVFFGLAILFFELERRKSKRPTPHDLSTLRGRTLKLRDDVQGFLDNAPPPGIALRVAKLHHGFELYFADSVKRIFHEFGERDIYDVELSNALSPNRQVNNEEMYRTIVQRLSVLADRPEAET